MVRVRSFANLGFMPGNALLAFLLGGSVKRSVLSVESGGDMGRTRGLLGTGLVVAVVPVALITGQSLVATDDNGFITGVVTSSTGPEAGVWVIADTDDLDTHFRKIVVTNDAGRFLLPEVPEATYSVWVRGYGLADSDPVTASPGTELELRGTVAATPQQAAEIYPANYWYSLIEPPPPNEFPGSGGDGNGIGSGLQTQGQWIDTQKQGCMLCHQLGTKFTREVPNLDQYDSAIAAWDACRTVERRAVLPARRVCTVPVRRARVGAR